MARRYLPWGPRTGVDVSDLSFLPDSVLWPLRRDGLDPVAEVGRRRAQEPISRLPVPFGVRAWLVTGYEEARAVLGKVDGFSNDFGNLVGSAGVGAQHNPGGLGFADPPVHTRLRRLLTPEFTMRRLSRLAPRIDAIVAERLDAMARIDGPVDLWREFALPIPSLTICELLGVPYSERDDFQRLSTARFDLGGGAGTPLGAMSQSVSYLLDLVAQQRRSPGDGLLGALIREHGDAIDDRELAGLADGVLTGGLETTASMLALGALVILRDPTAAELLAGGDGEMVNRFVEELLRHLSVVQVAFPRFATRDMEIAGVTIAAGDVVLCSLSGANRDPVLGGDLEKVDPTRPPRPHLAFGHGFHRCVGAELARMELRTAYPALVRRFPGMRLAVAPGQVSYRKASIVYGVDSLPVLLS
ncbi:cytochrome P450 [Planosporangium thailandense]|uniref:cytochrome P450 n=1 Tax=Planosporangium thailandense TaxID=765197 RepID=UPI001F0E8613|nr:cytochrome P450 [Planosporangium thailandense]